MDKFAEALKTPEAAYVINIFGAVCLIVLAIYVVSKIRDFAAGTMPKNGEYLTDFESMREEGLIDDKELNQVKSAVGNVVDDLVETKVDTDSDG